MATYAQLQAEQWWGREIVTPEMDWLGDELCRRTNRPRSAAGTKGDNNHLRGAHRSQEWIKNSRYCTSRTYTVQDGLTSTQLRHIAGFDFTPGSDSAMVAQCKRIYAAVKGGRLEEVREFYGNVDGDKVVDGWDNVKNRAASSDSSHLWHWHLAIDRRRCADRKLMERIVAIALGDPTEDDDMPLNNADLAKIRDQVTLGTYDALWIAAQGKDLPRNPALSYSGVGKAIRENMGALTVAPVLVALTSLDAVDEAKLAAALAPAVAQAVIAGLPDDRDDITVDELAEALRRVLGSVDGATPAAG